MEVNECDLRLGKMSRVGVDYRGGLPAGGFGDNFGVFRRGALPVKPKFCAGCGA